jgi:hypothetical protein
VTDKDPAKNLPIGVQKGYFMLSRSARAVLDTALQKYRPGRTELIPVGGIAQLKPALRLMMTYRLVIEESNGPEVHTSYTRWLESVEVKEGLNTEVYVAFNPRFERIWLEARNASRRILNRHRQPPGFGANTLFDSTIGRKDTRRRERRPSPWRSFEGCLAWNRSRMRRETSSKRHLCPSGRNFQQRALDVAIAQINKKTDLRIKLAAIERSKHRRVVSLKFTIKTQPIPKGERN